MAIVSAEITVDFTSWYIGNHNLCWRVQGSGDPYTCSVITCIGGGTSCSGSFLISVDDETCTDVTFEGYVQAACEAGLDDILPFTYLFVPTPTCIQYLLTAVEVPLEINLDITFGGSGYTIAPLVTIIGGAFSIAATVDTVTIAAGSVTGVTLLLLGSYSVLPAIIIAPPDTAGDTATANAVLGYAPGFEVPDCVSMSGINLPNDFFTVGTSVNICSSGASAPIVSDFYTLTVDGNCLCDCELFTLSISGSAAESITYYANLCNGVYETGVLVVGDSDITTCVVSGSVFWKFLNGTPTITTTSGGSCP